MPDFGPSAYDSDARGASTQRLINCYRQPVAGMGRTTHLIRSVLGTEDFASVGDVFFYAWHEMDGDIYAAFGGNLYRIGAGATSTTLGSIATGQTSISSNNGTLAIAAGGLYFTLSGSTIAPGTVDSLPRVDSVDFIDQYTIATGGRRFAWSDLADATTFPSLNFATAEATDDDILRGVTLNGRVILFKEESREVWYNTGQSGADAFLPLSGSTRNTGLKGFNLLTKTDDTLFYIGNDNIARITADGVGETKLSYPPVDTAISQGDPTDCYYYEDEGQKFCVIRFSDRPSWIFDLATGEWHERAWAHDFDPFPMRGTIRFGGSWYAVEDTGKIVRLTRNNRDSDLAGGTQALRRQMISPTFYAEEGASLDELEIYARTGFHDLGRDAQIWIRISRDGGHTWGLEKWRSLGGKGDFTQKATWRAQGQFSQLTIEANISEPDEIPIFSNFRMEAA